MTMKLRNFSRKSILSSIIDRREHAGIFAWQVWPYSSISDFCRWKISPMFSVHSSNIYCLCSKSNACICLASSVERLREENILKSGCFRCFSPAPFKTNCQLITSSSFSTLESETNSCFSDFPQRRKWALRTSGTPAPASTDRAPAAGKILLLI